MVRKLVVSNHSRMLVLLLAVGCDAADDEADEADAPSGGSGSGGAATEGDTEEIGESARAAEAAPSEGEGRRVPCGADGTRSYVVGDECRCFSGFSWCVPDDPGDLSCCVAGGEPEAGCSPNSQQVDGACVCDAGYAWCSDDPGDLSCCPEA